MSRTQPTEDEVTRLEFDCESCGAETGAWCVTRSGRWAEYLHSCRYWLAHPRHWMGEGA